MIEKIIFGQKVYAIIIKSYFTKEGIEFFTPGEYSQQLGYMNRPKGYIIEPHIHKHLERKVLYTQEVLLIRSGKIRADFYDQEQNYLDSRIICAGDVILLAAGGHGFEILEDAEIIEIKQGPYSEEDDKIRFTDAVPKKLMKII
jgi:hypothetical protein